MINTEILVTGRTGEARFYTPAAVRRGLLAAVCTFAVMAALLSGGPAPYLEIDPGLARLLRGMAFLKAGMVAAAFAALYWRLGFDVSRRALAAYCAGAALSAGGATLIWQLHAIPAAALAFHAGLLVLGITAWRDDREPFSV